MTPKCRKQMSMILRGSRALVASVTSPGRGEVGSRLRRRNQNNYSNVRDSGVTEECRVR
jgi:hypothetical protein